jgi:hypothetical protein
MNQVFQTTDFPRVFQEVMSAEMVSRLNEIDRQDQSTTTSVLSMSSDYVKYSGFSAGTNGILNADNTPIAPKTPNAFDFNVAITIEVDQAFYEDITDILDAVVKNTT